MSHTGVELTAAEKQALENMPGAAGVFQMIEDQIVPVYVTEHFRVLFGMDETEKMTGHDLYQLIYPEDADRVKECFARSVWQETELDIVFRCKNRHQSDYHVIHAAGKLVTRGGAKLEYMTVIDESGALDQQKETDLPLSEAFSQLVSLENNLFCCQYDDLTGLPMFGRFSQYAASLVQQMRNEGRIPAVLWLDCSQMRDYVLDFGMETGEALVCGLAWLIRDTFGIRNSAHFNSDYFIVCTEAGHLEEKITHLFVEEGKLNQGNSRPLAVGIYIMQDEKVGLAGAIDRAKLACDSLNEPAHSAYVYFDEKMQIKARMRQYVLQNYQKAMDRGWIQVYYQPVIRTLTGKLCGAEALCRWIDPVYGMISPGEFIPVLEEEGRISKLDLYMIEQVCKDGHKKIQDGINFVPVSVNLSRKDFRDPGIVDQIEALASAYKIPRELLNIEITESAFIRHPERLNHYVNRFHELGFQVWMDDFGTAYSSLGSLKDLKFDELKIDMSFLSTSSEKARTIITSVVRMAKEIGIQALAEGVETEEQYAFLKRIGCEKIQGYYFGRPMDIKTFISHCQKHHIDDEKPRWKNYYDALGRINFQTDEPLCVIEDDGRTMTLLFANEAYRSVLRRDGIENIEEWIKEINTDNNPAHVLHRHYADEQLRKLTGEQTITYPSGDHYMELSGRTVTRYENRYIYALNIRYIQLNAMSDDQKKAFYIQYLYYLCSDINVISLKENTVYGLKEADSRQPVSHAGDTADLRQAVKTYTKQFVYAPDQERYYAFANPSTMAERMRQKKGQDLTGFFRVRTADGRYQWTMHAFMPIPKSDFNRYLAVTLPIVVDPELRQLMQKGDYRTFAEKEEGITPDLLWKNLEAYAEGMYFWKDMNRRFVGASQSFLDYYGFDSLDDILGKTDEDMHWHVDAEAFKADELDVLQNGRRISFAKGKCIARGKQRTILANKEPLYRDGKIVGLIGNFFDVDALEGLLNDGYASRSVDGVTDLLNAKGISDSMTDYLEALWQDNMPFSMIQVYVPEYLAFSSIYGKKAGNTLLYCIGRILRKIFGKECSIGRLTGSYFTILLQDTDPEHLQKDRTRIQEEIVKLRRVGEWQCALSAQVRAVVLDQKNTSRETYVQSLGRMLIGFGAMVSEKKENNKDR